MAIGYSEVKEQVTKELEKVAQNASSETNNISSLLATNQEDLLNQIGLSVQRR